MATGWPMKVSYANGDVFSASDVNDITGTINLLTSSTLSSQAGKNIIINGGMDIWQRGTSIAGTASAIYTADRFCLYQNTAATISRQATSDTTNLPNIQYCMRAQRNNASTSTTGVSIAQSLETVNSIPFAGKTVTYSFYARKGANFSAASSIINVYVVSGTGTDQNIQTSYTGAAYPVNSTATLTTTWQRFTFTATISSSATELAAYQSFTPVGTAGAADYFEITGVQLELGSTATTFSRAGGTIQGELAACQRYYWRLASGSAEAIGNGNAYSASQVQAIIQYPVSMRVAPALDQTTGTDYYRFIRNGGTDSFNSFTIDGPSVNSTNIFNNTQISSTAGNGGVIFTNNASAYLAFTSEL